MAQVSQNRTTRKGISGMGTTKMMQSVTRKNSNQATRYQGCVPPAAPSQLLRSITLFGFDLLHAPSLPPLPKTAVPFFARALLDLRDRGASCRVDESSSRRPGLGVVIICPTESSRWGAPMTYLEDTPPREGDTIGSARRVCRGMQELHFAGLKAAYGIRLQQ